MGHQPLNGWGPQVLDTVLPFQALISKSPTLVTPFAYVLVFHSHTYP